MDKVNVGEKLQVSPSWEGVIITHRGNTNQAVQVLYQCQPVECALWMDHRKKKRAGMMLHCS